MDCYICALEFNKDKNLLCRKYLYKVSFRVSVGDKLVAPIGPHNKLQIGSVTEVYVLRGERLYKTQPACFLTADDGEEGERLRYPLSAIKSAVCKYTFRRAAIPDCVNARDVGGLLYDDKHLVSYGAFVRADIPRVNLADFNFSAVVYFSDEEFSFGVKAYRFPVLYRPYEGERGGISSKFPFFRRSAEGNGKVERILHPADFGADAKGENGGFALAEGEPEQKVMRAYDEKALMNAAFRALAIIDGTLLLCDRYGAYSVDIIVMPLYLLVGVQPESIYKDYALSDYCINEKYIEGDKFGENEYVPEFTEREYNSLVKKFLKEYGSAEKYLRYLGLDGAEICRLKQKLTIYKG